MNTRGIVKKVSELLMAIAMVVGFSAMAHADLTVVGTGTMQGVSGSYQLIYDSGQNITWLDYSAPINSWNNQVAWASGLTVNVNGVNISGWSLPTTVDNQSSYGIQPSPTSSEMAYLYYTELGDTGYPQSGYGLTNAGPFKNLNAADIYWSGTEYSGHPGNAWVFNFGGGAQGEGDEVNYANALAVHPGDVVPTPIPGTMLLFGSGLGGLIGMKRRRG